jgi:hypothetical protein
MSHKEYITRDGYTAGIYWENDREAHGYTIDKETGQREPETWTKVPWGYKWGKHGSMFDIILANQIKKEGFYFEQNGVIFFSEDQSKLKELAKGLKLTECFINLTNK